MVDLPTPCEPSTPTTVKSAVSPSIARNSSVASSSCGLISLVVCHADAPAPALAALPPSAGARITRIVSTALQPRPAVQGDSV